MDTSTFHSPDSSAAAVAQILTGAGFALSSPITVTRTVLDTFDGRVHGAGLRLELRRAGRVVELVLQDVKDPTAAPGVARASRAPTFAADLPPGPLRARLAPLLEMRALRPVLKLTARVTTASRPDKAGKERVDLAIHDELVIGHEHVRPWAVEVRARTGYEKEATAAAALLAKAGLRATSGDVVSAVIADLGFDLAGFQSSPTVPLRPDAPALGAFRRTLDNLAAAVEANHAGTLEAADTEFLHDLRVAVRRTRSVLAQGRHVIPDPVRDRFREEFGWLGAATSPARDLDVYLLEWSTYLAMVPEDGRAALEPVRAHLATRCMEEHAILRRVLRSKRYKSVMAEWRAWLTAGGDDEAGRDAGRPIGEVAADRITKAQDQLLSRGRAITPDTPGEELHELRKDAKKLRYLLECLGGLYAPARRKPFVQRLKALQDNLGEHQDAEVHATELQAVAAELGRKVKPATLIAIGQLSGSLDGRRQAARAEFAGRFAEYDTKQTAATLRDLLRS